MPTCTEYIKGLAKALNDFGEYNVSSGSASAFASAALIKAASTSASAHDGDWAYNETNHQQRRAKTGGFDPATGTLTIEPTWTAPAAGVLIALTHLFPWTIEISPADTSYLQIINRALSMLVVWGEITLTIVPNQTDYSLATYAHWLDREERLGWPAPSNGQPQPKMLEPSPSATGQPIPADWRRPRLAFVGGTPHLRLAAPFVTGSSGLITLNIQRPGDTLINDAESTIGFGLGSDTETAVPSLNAAVETGKLEVYSLLAQRGVSSATGSYASMVAPQLAKCRQLLEFDETMWKPTPAASQALAQAA